MSAAIRPAYQRHAPHRRRWIAAVLASVQVLVLATGTALAAGASDSRSSEDIAAELEAAVAEQDASADVSESDQLSTLSADADTSGSDASAEEQRTEQSGDDAGSDGAADDAAASSDEDAASASSDAGTDESADESADATDAADADGSSASSDDAPDDGGSEGDESRRNETDGDGAPEGAEADDSEDDTDALERSDAAEDEDAMDAMSVPSPGDDEAVVSVRTGAVRTGTNSVQPLQGAELALFDSLSDTTPINESWATCVSDADGDCSFVIPETGCDGSCWLPSNRQDNRDRELYVKAIDAPDGFQVMPGVGTGTSSNITAGEYGFRVGGPTTRSPNAGNWQLRAGNTYTSTGGDFMLGGSDNDSWASGGWFAFVVDNPPRPDQCGIDIALIFDFSSSMDGYEDDLARAATALVNAMEGTPSTVSLYNFGHSSPTDGFSSHHLPVQQQVATAGGATTVREWYSTPGSNGQTANFSIPGNTHATNWDRGLYVPATTGDDYDVAVVITDGNPTVYGSPADGPQGSTRVREVENGVFSANAFKNLGTHVLAVGAGQGVQGAGSGLNLQAISGPVQGQDYFQTPDFDEAGDVLAQMVRDDCAGSLTVVKETVGPDQDLSEAQPAAGWEFQVAASDPSVEISPPSGTTAESTGAVAFDLDFEANPDATTSLTVTEEDREDFELVSVECRDTTAGASIPVNLEADGLSFTLENVAAGATISCEVVNQEEDPSASVVVTKQWEIDGETYAHSSQPTGFDAQLQLDGPETTEPSNQPWAQARDGYTAGDEVAIDETVDINPEMTGCALTGQAVTAINGSAVDPIEFATGSPYLTDELVVGVNEFEITNTVECTQTLTLRKNVVGGDADADDWLLQAFTSPANPLGGSLYFEGRDGVSSEVEANATYQLSEAEGHPDLYRQDDNRTDLQERPLSTGSWHCIQVDEDGDPVAGSAYSDGINGGATIPRGFHVDCTATNRLIPLPQVDKTNGAAADNGDGTWDISFDVTVTRPQVSNFPQSIEYSLVEIWPEMPDNVTLLSGWNVTSTADGFTPISDETAAPYFVHTGELDDGGDSDAFTVSATVSVAPDATASPDDRCESPTTDGIDLYNYVEVRASILANGGGPGGPVVDDDDDCATIPLPEIDLDKLVTDVSFDGDAWTIEYDVIVSNLSNVTALYTLDDQLRFSAPADGITITAAEWEGPGPLGGAWNDFDAPLNFVTDQALGGGDSDRFAVTVTAEVAGEYFDDPVVCGDPDDVDGSAFLNVATASGDGQTHQAHDCAEPSLPRIQKDLSSVVYDGDEHEWLVSYSIVVDNADGHASVYDLYDAPGFPQGVDIVDTAVTGPAGSLPWSGDPADAIVVDEPIGADARHEYVVQVALTVPGEVLPPGAEECDEAEGAGYGLYNEARIEVGGIERDDDACGDLDEQARPDADKTVTSVVHGANANEWVITYQIEVSQPAEDADADEPVNTAGLSAFYRLDDTLDFGGDIAVLDASWEHVGTSRDGAFVDGSALLADEWLIRAGDTHTYEITVTAEVDPAAFVANGGVPSASCDSSDIPSAGGFLNTAQLTAHGQSTDLDACEEPTRVEVAKTAESATHAGGDQWDVSYLVSVENVGNRSDSYWLTDTPDFPADASIDDVSVFAVADESDDGVEVDADWDGTDLTIVAEDDQAAIGAGSTHLYRVIFTASLDRYADADQYTCATAGFDNTATLYVGPNEQSDDDCLDIDPPIVDPSVDKTAVSVEQQPDGQWALHYQIEVSQPEQGAGNELGLAGRYDLTDELTFGSEIAIAAAGWADGVTDSLDTGDYTAFDNQWNTVIAQNAEVAAGETDVYTVFVVADLGADAVGAPDTFECADPDGPPDASAFTNVAGVTRPGDDDSIGEDWACAEPALPQITKTDGTATDNGDGTWDVSYLISVTRESDPTYDGPLAYVVTDNVPSMPDEVELADGWNVASDVDGFVPIDGATGTIDVHDGLLAGDGPDEFVVSATVAVNAETAAVPDELCQTGQVGVDLHNRAGLQITQDGPIIDEDDDCATIEFGAATVDKSVTSVFFDGDVWNIVYEVDVTSGDMPAVYTLQDELRFAPASAGVGIESAQWTGPGGLSGSWSDGFDQVETFVADRYLEAESTETYTVTVTATVDAGPDDYQDLQCSAQVPEDGGEAFLNEATVIAGGEDDTDHACGEPTLPQINKTIVAAREYDPATHAWIVSYNIDVSNAGGHATVYDLYDEPGYPDGVDIQDITVYDVDGDDLTDVTGDWSGEATEPILTDVDLDADGVHTYRVDVELSIPTTVVPPEAMECDEAETAGYGLYNEARIAVGDTVIEDADCGDIEEFVTPSVSKTTTQTTPHDVPGQWQITYEIEATQPAQDADADAPINPDGISAFYDVTDRLDYGDGISVLEADWELLTDVDPWNGTTNGLFVDGEAVLADAELIAAGDTHVFTVTVIAEVTADAHNSNDGDAGVACAPGGSEAGGFLNTAWLTSHGSEDHDTDCTEPATASLAKVGEPSTYDNGVWTVSYLVEVSNDRSDNGAPDAPYQLTETPDDLPDGVEVTGPWKAEAVEGTPPITGTSGWTYGDDLWEVTTGAVGVGETHTYRVWVELEVTDADALPEAEGCESAADRGIVIVNAASISWGGVTDDDQDCAVIHFDDVGLVKTNGLDESVTAVTEGDTFEYVLTVTNFGTRCAAGVVVTDVIPDDLEVLDATGPAGWNVNVDGNIVTAAAESFEVDGEIDIVIDVAVRPLEAQIEETVEAREANGELPDPIELDEIDILNSACVEAMHDENPDNNCDEDEIPVQAVVADVSVECAADASYLVFSVATTPNLADETITMDWYPVDGEGMPVTDAVPASAGIGEVQRGEVYRAAWPGSAWSPGGFGVDWPGWRPVVADDYDGDGNLIDGQEYANGMVLDETQPDYPWRFGTEVSITVNPEVVVRAEYPAATPDCTDETDTELDVVKSASVETTEPGEQFEYAIDIENVHDNGAATNVVLTDEIPSELRVDQVDTVTEGDVPFWNACDVSGVDADGFGGTLTCELTGVLYAQALEGGSSQAPTVNLTVTVHDDASGDVTNIADVDYCAFNDEEVCGEVSDDVVVTVDAGPPSEPPVEEPPVEESPADVPPAASDRESPGADSPERPTGQLPFTGASVVVLIVVALVLLMLGAALLRRRKRASETV